jgi:predicted acylesterase/phospholipase RssA
MVAFGLGGSGILVATQLGMLRALAADGVRPDLVVGTSVGALNGATLAADPSSEPLERLTELWSSLSKSTVFAVVLSSGMEETPLVSLRYRDTGRVATRIERAYEVSRAVLARAK